MLRGGRLADPDEAVDPRPAARPFDSLDKLRVPSGCLLGRPAGRTGDAHGGRDPSAFPAGEPGGGVEAPAGAARGAARAAAA